MADVTHAQALIEGIKADAVLADKAYDANHVLEYLAQRNIQAVIPPKANRVAAQSQHPLQAQGTDTLLLAGEIPSGSQPNRQRRGSCQRWCPRSR